MIMLSDQQHEEIAAIAGPVTVVDPKTSEEYVLVKAAVFERMRKLLVDDSIVLDKRELAILVDRAMSEYDANDPTLHLYQED